MGGLVAGYHLAITVNQELGEVPLDVGLAGIVGVVFLHHLGKNLANGMVEIEALGKEFDPLFHNAVLQQPSEEYESGVIMQVYRKGYMYKDKVLRHSMVIVAQ